jgi:UDP-N-acetylmuramate--alanine ligase
MKIHLIGIGGSGISAIARILLERGHTVSGSDILLSPQAEKLAQDGAQVFPGHQPGQVHGADLVIRSSAIPDTNPEVAEARRLGIPVLKRADYLVELLADSYTIAVAGTHGKTTTTAMISWLLTALNRDPSFIVGGTISNLNTNARSGSGREFVIEADEYDNMFLGLEPDLAVVTNVEYDHPDLFPDPETYFSAFLSFTGRVKRGGRMLVCSDDEGAGRLAGFPRSADLEMITYGISGSPVYLGENIREGINGGPIFDFRRGEELFARVGLRIPGLHTVQNAVAALAVIDLLGHSVVEAAQALRDFRGAHRRFQILGTASGVVVIDDYAHHPSEIRATLSAARSHYPEGRIWAVWQPHTYFRTQTFFDEFVQAFEMADHVVVTEIFVAREEPSKDFSGRNLVEAMDHPDVIFAGDFQSAIDHMLENLSPGDVVLILSAGDADVIGIDLLQALDRPGPGQTEVRSRFYRASPA